MDKDGKIEHLQFNKEDDDGYDDDGNKDEEDSN